MTTTQKTTVTINGENFEQAVLKSDQPVLVDFWAEWCAPCRAVGPVVEEIAQEFEGAATVGKINVDENKSLARQFAIASIPTLLFFKDGEVVDRIQGVVAKREIVRKLMHVADATSS